MLDKPYSPFIGLLVGVDFICEIYTIRTQMSYSGHYLSLWRSEGCSTPSRFCPQERGRGGAGGCVTWQTESWDTDGFSVNGATGGLLMGEGVRCLGTWASLGDERWGVLGRETRFSLRSSTTGRSLEEKHNSKVGRVWVQTP